MTEQLKHVLLKIVKVIRQHLFDDVASVLESITDTQGGNKCTEVVMCVAAVCDHMELIALPRNYRYDPPPIRSRDALLEKFQRQMHYGLWTIHAKLHILPHVILVSNAQELVALAKALKAVKDVLLDFVCTFGFPSSSSSESGSE